ncbi:MAG TPA: hypothetical protein VGY57_13440 [Vicinamibacterales bacterium]|nr:hypothetical protein [Vicinamibacterales bacterium]
MLTQNSRNSQNRFISACSALIVVLVWSSVASAQPNFPTAIPQTKFNSGQDVVPYFEGWIRNTDGSFDMVFGYFNRNWQEELAIAPGPNNSVVVPGQGGPDRGQPTYFLPRRQAWSFRVRVPANFGKQEVTWTIVANGKKEVAFGTLEPVEEITERIIMTRGGLNPGEEDPNKPPVVTIAPVANASAAAPVTLTALVTDDGLPKPREALSTRPAGASSVGRGASATDATRIQAQANSNATPRARGLTVSWMEVRGPAKVTFEKATGLAVVDGKATVTAKFAAPGMYVLRASANDGALTTKADVTVMVQ